MCEHNIFLNLDLRWKPTSADTKISDQKPRLNYKSTSLNVYHIQQFYTYTNFSFNMLEYQRDQCTVKVKECTDCTFCSPQQSCLEYSEIQLQLNTSL